MTTAIRGRRPWGVRQFLLTGLAICTLAGLFGGLVLAAHLGTGVFELEGDALNDPAVEGEDSANIYCREFPADPDCAALSQGPDTALVSTFDMDKVEDPTDDIFDGATDSKNIICQASDPGGCSDWGWKVGEPNDKNDIQNFFAAIYQAPNDDFILVFGLDKLDNSGDAALGFWFLQNDVAKVTGGEFSAPHKDGDVLVQADVTSGGDVPRIDAYTWGPNSLLNDPTQPSHGDLRLAIEGAECDAIEDPDACGIMNLGNPDDKNEGVEVAPWTHLFKAPGGIVTRNPAEFPVATYFEGGLNLSALFGQNIPCIQSFLVETRQSQSETAQLEDMGLTGFELCSIVAAKTGPGVSKVGDNVEYTVTITNDGALPLDKVSISDSMVGDLTSNCGVSLDPGESCTFTYERVVMVGDPDPLVNTVTVTYDRAGTEVTFQDSHSVDLIQPAISFDKSVTPSTGFANVTSFSYTLDLSNDSSAGTPNLECNISDPVLGVDTNVTLPTGQSVQIPGTKVWDPVNADSGDCSVAGTGYECTNTATVNCSPVGMPNQLPASDSKTVRVDLLNAVVTVTKTGDQYGKVGDPVDYVITISNLSDILDVELNSVIDNVLGDLQDVGNVYVTSSDCPNPPAVLGSLSSCTIMATRAVMSGDDNPLENTVVVVAADPITGEPSDPITADHSVDLFAPAMTVRKDCTTDPVREGNPAIFRIDIDNTGDVNLIIDISDPDLNINETGVLLGERGGAECTEEAYDNADASDGCHRVMGSTTATGDQVTNVVDVTWTLPEFLGLSNTDTVSDDAVCEVEQDGATRTWGFWKTHGSDGGFTTPVEYGFTCHIAEDHVIFTIDLGWTMLHNCADVFGVFWSSPAMESDGSKRGSLCRVKLQASWQLLAAILNDGLTNGAPVPDDPDNPGTSIIDAMIAELGGDMRRREIIRLKGLLAGYNESADEVMIEDADNDLIPHADPNGTRDAADYTAGDCP